MPKRKIFRSFFLTAVILGLASCISAYICYNNIKNAAQSQVFSDVNQIPYNKVGLLLGTSRLLKDGRGNPFFQYRIEAAAHLFHAGKISYILASGDHGKMSYNESEDMKNALIEKGVPESAIILDYAGFRTLDSVVRCKEVFEQSSVTIISQRFHNERAIYLAAHFGISAVGYNAQDALGAVGYGTYMREYFARVKVYIDLAFGKQPKFLGEKIKIG